MDKITKDFVSKCLNEWFEFGFDYDKVGMTRYVLESAGHGVFTELEFQKVASMF